MNCSVILFKNPKFSLVFILIFSGLIFWKLVKVIGDGGIKEIFRKENFYELCFLLCLLILLLADNGQARKCTAEENVHRTFEEKIINRY